MVSRCLRRAHKGRTFFREFPFRTPDSCSVYTPLFPIHPACCMACQIAPQVALRVALFPPVAFAAFEKRSYCVVGKSEDPGILCFRRIPPETVPRVGCEKIHSW